MRKWIGIIGATGCFLLLCNACETSSGPEDDHPTEDAWRLFEPVNKHLDLGRRMAVEALTFNEYYKLQTEDERMRFRQKYFRGKQIAHGGGGWYIIEGESIEWRITITNGLALDEPGAMWKIYSGSVPGVGYETGDSHAILSPGDVSGTYNCSVRSNMEFRSVNSKFKISVVPESDPLAVTITGSGVITGRSPGIKYRIETPLYYDIASRYPVGGVLAVESQSAGKDDFEAQYAPDEQVKIIYNSAEEWWHISSGNEDYPRVDE